MQNTAADHSQARVYIADKLVGAICRHCSNQVLDGNEFCSWEHYEYWYHEEQRRIFGQANQ